MPSTVSRGVQFCIGFITKANIIFFFGNQHRGGPANISHNLGKKIRLQQKMFSLKSNRFLLQKENNFQKAQIE